jgi:hypothetical protein
MSPTSKLHLKILSLAVVVWALISHVSLSFQGIAWVPWMALLMLMLLDAYSGHTKPVTWSNWSGGLGELVGPGMLPYYAVLLLSLGIGPGQMHRGERVMPNSGPTASALATSLPARPAPPPGFPKPTGPTQSARPGVNPNSKFSRPTVTTPQQISQPVGVSAAPTGTPSGNVPATNTQPLIPATASTSTSSAKPAAPPTQPSPIATPAAPSAVAPTSSAKPAAAPVKAEAPSSPGK